MSDIFLKILNMSFNASWLILVVLVLRFVLKKAPKWAACLLWALVAVRLMCPVTLESVFSLLPSGQVVPEDITVSQRPEIHSGIPFVNNAVNPLISGTITQDIGAEVNPIQIIISVASAIWIAGIVLMLMYALISYIRLKRKVRASINVRDNIMVCDDIETPFILGFFEPMIYVPSFVAGDTLELVIAHEETHIERFDHWWKPLGMLLLSVYWFNPLCWIAYIMLCRDIEAACDEKVIQGKDHVYIAAYSQALLDLSVTRRTITACPLAFGETGVKSRIRDVLNYRKPAFWAVFVAVISCIAAGVCFLTNPSSAGNNTHISDDLRAFPEEKEVEHFKNQTENDESDTKNNATAITEPRRYLYSKNVNEKMGDIYFTITLNPDGTFEWYETPISSFIGYGKYTIEDGILALPLDKEMCGTDDVNYFKYSEDELIFIKEGSDNFHYVKLEDGAVFNYSDDDWSGNSTNGGAEHEGDTVIKMENGEDADRIGLSISIFSLEPDGCLLMFTQSGGEITGRLETGQAYVIQKRDEQGNWTDLPVPDSIGWEDIAYDIEKDAVTEMYVKWKNMYGILEPGHYRIVKQVMDFRGTGDYDTYNVSAEFDIGDPDE